MLIFSLMLTLGPCIKCQPAPDILELVAPLVPFFYYFIFPKNLLPSHVPECMFILYCLSPLKSTRSRVCMDFAHCQSYEYHSINTFQWTHVLGELQYTNIHIRAHTHGRLEQMLFKRETTRRILEWSCAEKWATTYQTLTLFISGQTSTTYLQSSCAVVMLHDEKSSGYFGNVPLVLWGSTELKSKDAVLDNNSLCGHVLSLCLSLLIFKLNTSDQVMVKGFSCTCDSVMGGQGRLDRTVRVFLFLFRHMATKHHPIVI